MFVDDHFILEDGRYVATEAFLDHCLEAGKTGSADGSDYFEELYGENPTYEISFAYENDAHTFSYRFIAEDGRLVDEMILTLTFGDVTVQFPLKPLQKLF